MRDIIAVYDNPQYTERYTIVLSPKKFPSCLPNHYPSLAVSTDCDSPQGVSQFCDCKLGPHLGKKIGFDQLPKHVQAHVLRRLVEA